MTEELLKERKEAMLALINDPTYVPMKIKELAMLLDVPREKRDELKEVLDALVADGKWAFPSAVSTESRRLSRWWEASAAMRKALAL